MPAEHDIARSYRRDDGRQRLFPETEYQACGALVEIAGEKCACKHLEQEWIMKMPMRDDGLCHKIDR